MEKFMVPDDWDVIYDIPFVFNKVGKHGTMSLQNIITFDIETSSAFVTAAGKVRAFNPKKYDKNQKYRDLCDKSKPVAITYAWMYAVEDIQNDIVYKFLIRNWGDYEEFTGMLTAEIRRQAICGFNCTDRICENFIASKSKVSVRARCYIHNAGFEFQHMRNVFEGSFKQVFARNSHKPMKWHININKVHFEFRCSYFLTQKSLDNWAKDENLAVTKADKIDYSKIRHPETVLEPELVDYALRDVVTMVYGIRKYRDKYGSIDDIVLTQTGEVRYDLFNSVCKTDPRWCKLMVDIASTYDSIQYKKLLKLFAGGWTHANKYYANKNPLVNDDGSYKICHCWDLSSSYPASMTIRKMPVSIFECRPVKEFWDLEKVDVRSSNYRWWARIRVKNCMASIDNSFWSISKTDKASGIIADNGRCEFIGSGEISIIDTDWEIFKEAYDFDNSDIEVLELQRADAGYLSKDLILKILQYYGDKTSLKGVKDRESEYKAGKQKINGIYGCFVTKVAMDQVEFGDNGWNVTPFESLGEEYFDQIIGSLKQEKQFGCYQLGIWVTGWSRWTLWKMILKIDKNRSVDRGYYKQSSLVYGDTDSLKGYFTDEEMSWFHEFNKQITLDSYMVADYYGFDRDLYNPKTIKGVAKPLGWWDQEEDAVLKTLGAKRYVAVHDGQLETTIAGLPKSAGSKKIKTIEDFNNHTVWGANESGKLTAYYIDDMEPMVWTDHFGKSYKGYDKYGISLKPTSFDMSLSSEFESFLSVLMGHQINTQENDQWNNDPTFVYDDVL